MSFRVGLLEPETLPCILSRVGCGGSGGLISLTIGFSLSLSLGSLFESGNLWLRSYPYVMSCKEIPPEQLCRHNGRPIPAAVGIEPVTKSKRRGGCFQTLRLPFLCLISLARQKLFHLCLRLRGPDKVFFLAFPGCCG